jgi:hypothetical protein
MIAFAQGGDVIAVRFKDADLRRKIVKRARDNHLSLSEQIVDLVKVGILDLEDSEAGDLDVAEG